MRIKNLKVATKFNLLISLSFLAIILVTSLMLVEYRNSLFENKKDKARALVEVAYSLAIASLDEYKNGEVTLEQAQEHVKKDLRQLKYDENNYFWINDYDLVMVMHPKQSHLDGTDLSQFSDPNGIFLFQDFVKVAKEKGHGFVQYMWPKPGHDTNEPMPKISYVKGIPEWQWLIGSGVYIDDINKAFLTQLTAVVSIMLSAFVLVGVLGGLVVRSLSGPIIRISDGLTLLADNKTIKVSDYDRQDEIGLIAKALRHLNTRLEESRIMEREQAKIQKYANAKLKDAKKKAEDANQIKTEFLAKMSHELRTPLNSIIGMTEMTLKMKMGDEQRDMISIAHQASHSLLEIVNDILDISKIEASEVTLEQIGFDFHKTLSSIVKIYNPMAVAKGLTLNYEFEKDNIPYLVGDPARLGIILTNLIGNSIKYTDEGHVSIYISYTNLGPKEIELKCSVIDTGIGIPKSKYETIFQKFSQADESITRKFGGTGLGLAITKELVCMMKGKVGVDSVQGEGTTFWFNIPFETTENLHEESLEYEDTYNSNDDIKKIDAKEAKVLIAEDHELNQVFIKKLIGKLGFVSYDLVENGKEAVDTSENNSYDLILMDCHMPEMNGYQATQAIRSREKLEETRVPIVAVTADAMIGTREKCLESGMDDYITKPININKLREVLSRWFVLPISLNEDK